MYKSPIKVFLVDDSPIALKIIGDLLDSITCIDVIGKYSSAKAALSELSTLSPDVICTDFYMQGMNGLEFTQQIMSNKPTPILVASVSARTHACRNAKILLNAGAVEIWPKPALNKFSDYEQNKAELIEKIKILSGVKVFKRPIANQSYSDRSLSSAKDLSYQCSSVNDVTQALKPLSHRYKEDFSVIAIGSSTGGPQALKTILSKLPPNLPVPILCTQHISEGFLQGLVDCMQLECDLQIKIAEPNESPSAGVVYFAPEKHHLLLSKNKRFVYGNSIKADIHCPSVTSMFQSIASTYGKETLSILLTGMGRDGALGMQEIYKQGGLTIAQDENTSIVFGMPAEAIALNAVQHILPLPNIAEFVLSKL